MGVHGLWDLLAPVGRRVSVETLAGKKLAIDASIWMVQFMKAMRDEKGDMVRNAHLLGFFRRVCKLLFLRTKPVFVFDGGTPALKRRTVIARRRHRENAKAKIRKTAEKLLLNHLKAQSLEGLAKEIKNQKQNVDSKGKQVVSDEMSVKVSSERTAVSSKVHVQEIGQKIDSKGKQVVNGDSSSSAKVCSERTEMSSEALDELLAASLASEEDTLYAGPSTAAPGATVGEESEGDEDEEVILPVMNGGLDPTVLAALPPSMQLDLLVQMRERLMAENRQKYQQVKKAPSKFSELQIQSYLKTVAFRREIDQVQKAAAGRGIGGVQTSRIASEANREFIFSSSFSGDKQVLTSSSIEEHRDDSLQGRSVPSSDIVTSVSSTLGLHSLASTSVNEQTTENDQDIGTYIDELGRFRVSRVRGFGIRMTRDLQRNLDLMKEFEREKERENVDANRMAILESLSDNNHIIQVEESERENNVVDETETLCPWDDDDDIRVESMQEGGSALEISFVDDCQPAASDENDIFAQLVAGDSSKSFPKLDDLSFVQPNGSDEDVEWEEGTCDVPGNASPCPNEAKAVSVGDMEEEADIQKAIERSLEDLAEKKALCDLSKVPESDMQQAAVGQEFEQEQVNCPHHPLGSGLLRSLEPCEPVDGVAGKENICETICLLDQDNLKHNRKLMSPTDDKFKDLNNEMSSDRRVGLSTSSRYENSTAEAMEVINTQEEPYMGSPEVKGAIATTAASLHSDISPGTDLLVDTHITVVNSSQKRLTSEVKMNSLEVETGVMIEETPISDRDQEPYMGSPRERSAGASITASVSFDISEEQRNRSTDLLMDTHVTVDNSSQKRLTSEFEKNSLEVQAGVMREETPMGDIDQELNPVKDYGLGHEGEFAHSEKPLGDTLDEEMLNLKREREVLGDEKRKHERNAEYVSSEMFAECQELLQMFGLPYIIAPMEAEAQCAYMEMTNLVDGVVTDDSDVFLFGARSVYKNIFDDRKYVETYFMKDIEAELGLSREMLIRMALLLGSDYTEGVSGIGIVNAIEVVNAFPEDEGLQEFREWLESPDPAILGKLDAHSRKKFSKTNHKEADSTENVEISSSDAPGLTDQKTMDNLSGIKQIFMDKHRNVSKNWHIPPSFPSESVVTAYTCPKVDESTEPFSWGKPDLFVLRKLCWERFGWNNQKADELLIPVLKEYNKHETQMRLEAFYTFNEKFAKIRSRRIKKAVKGITGSDPSDLGTDIPDNESMPRKKGGKNTLKNKVSTSMETSHGANDGISITEKSVPERKQPRKRKIKSQFFQTETHISPLSQNKGRQNSKGGRSRNSRGRGRGGRGLGQKEEPILDTTDSSSSDYEQNIDYDSTNHHSVSRKSTRHRSRAKYAEQDSDSDVHSYPLSHSNGNNKDTTIEACSSGQDFVANKQVRQDNEPSAEKPAIKDCLLSGGGFCMDEDEPTNQAAEPISVPTTETEVTTEEFRLGSLEDTPSADNEKLSGQGLMHEKETAQEMLGRSVGETNFVSEPSLVDVSLSSMPNLRRKRRKF